MKGLIKNHYYKIVSNLKVLLAFIGIVGIGILLLGGKKEMLLSAFLCLAVIAFPLVSSMGLQKNNNGKWNQYLITLPVRRCDIIKSVFSVQIMIITFGSILSLGLFLASFSIHGFAFYRYVDVFLLFSTFIGISLMMSAIFFPISYLDSKDRTEVGGIISLVIAGLIMAGLITLGNTLLKKPSEWELFLFGIGVLILATVIYLSAYFLTKKIYEGKEY